MKKESYRMNMIRKSGLTEKIKESQHPYAKWISVFDELPPEDGTYEISNHPYMEDDPIRREMTATAFYDGYGFSFLGVYREPHYWRKYEFKEKRYGKVTQQGEPQ